MIICVRASIIALHVSCDRIFIFVVVDAEIYIAFYAKETARKDECLAKYPQDRLMNAFCCTHEIINKRERPAASEVCHCYGNIVAVMVCCGCSAHFSLGERNSM